MLTVRTLYPSVLSVMGQIEAKEPPVVAENRAPRWLIDEMLHYETVWHRAGHLDGQHTGTSVHLRQLG
jgi:hypothetical protein